MPVRLREIGADGELLIAESIEHMFQHVATGIVLEGVLGDREVRFVGVEHTETIMVLRGEDHVFHACIAASRSPLGRIKLRGTEFLSKTEVPVHILLIGTCGISCNPVLVADGPRLHHAGHGVQPPMEQHAELQVLPLLQVLHNQLFRRPFIDL